MGTNVTAFNLTMPLDGAVRVKGYRPTMVLRNQTTLDGLQRVSSIQLSPHSLTHLDLVNRVNWDAPELKERRPAWLETSPAKTEVIAPVGKAMVFPCTVVSLMGLYEHMSTACREVWPNTAGLPSHFRQYWPKAKYLSLMHDLRIDKDRLRHSAVAPRGILVFQTGWRQFSPGDGDITHPDWYPWHPYVMNPYMDEDTVNFLFDDLSGPRLEGLGCDIGTLDSPLRHFALGNSNNPEDRFPHLPDALASKSLCVSHMLTGAARFEPVHIGVLGRRKILLEQLRLPIELHRHHAWHSAAPGSYATIKGSVLIHPVSCSRDTDALLVSAIFIPES